MKDQRFQVFFLWNCLCGFIAWHHIRFLHERKLVSSQVMATMFYEFFFFFRDSLQDDKSVQREMMEMAFEFLFKMMNLCRER
jgi:hypothetical protein